MSVNPGLKHHLLTDQEVNEVCLSRKHTFPHLMKVIDDRLRNYKGYRITDSETKEQCGVLFYDSNDLSRIEFTGAIWPGYEMKTEEYLVRCCLDLAGEHEEVLLLWSDNRRLSSRVIKKNHIAIDHREARMSGQITEQDVSSFTENPVTLAYALAEHIDFLAQMDHDGFGDDYNAARSFYEEQLSTSGSNENIFVASIGDRLVGKILIFAYENLISLFGLVVAGKERGKGIGKEIVRCLKRRYAGSPGPVTFWLEVDTDNNRAINTYSRTGFSVDYNTVYYRVPK